MFIVLLNQNLLRIKGYSVTFSRIEHFIADIFWKINQSMVLDRSID